MKYGLIYYKDTENLGDDILTYAGARFMPQIDYCIDREAMDEFIPDIKEKVVCIVNGWYLHNPFTFPPSPYVYPLFCGIHFEIDTLTSDFTYLQGMSQKYLQKYGPIGCRDIYTMDTLSNRSIPSYFSGCLTLALDIEESIPGDIVITDANPQITEYIRTKFSDRIICELTHTIPETERGKEWGQVRENRVKNALRIYKGAKVVITSRLHVALPCLALGTPVLLVGRNSDDYRRRILDYEKYLHVVYTDDFLFGKADDWLEKGFKNKDISQIREDVIQRCKSFVDDAYQHCIDASGLPSIEDYRSIYADRIGYTKYAMKMAKEQIMNLKMTHLNDVQTMQEMVKIAEMIAAGKEESV